MELFSTIISILGSQSFIHSMMLILWGISYLSFKIIAKRMDDLEKMHIKLEIKQEIENSISEGKADFHASLIDALVAKIGRQSDKEQDKNNGTI